MNSQNAHEYLPLVQALADGKTIQFKEVVSNEWVDRDTCEFTYSAKYYRIKPEPRTFEMWRNLETGDMYNSFNPSYFAANRYERITVQEVL